MVFRVIEMLSRSPSAQTGQFIAYRSFATNIVANDTNGVDDIFVYNRANRTTQKLPINRSSQSLAFSVT